MKRNIGGLFLSIAILLLAPSDIFATDAKKEKLLQFSDRASLGRLYLLSDQYPLWQSFALQLQKDLGEANGSIPVPAKAKLMLLVDYAAAQNPSLLASYVPNAVIGLDFSKSKADDRLLPKISALIGLTALRLDESNLSDQGLMSLSKLKNLEYLSLARTALSDRGLKLLPLQSLESLVLSGTKVTDNGLTSLQKCLKLKCLCLDETNISDNGLREIQKCRDLQYLGIGKCTQVTDAGLRSLASLPQLRDLRLVGDKRITAKGLLQLTALKKLNRLRLRDTGITAQDLQVIKNLTQKVPSIDTLVLEDKSFTSAAIKKWKHDLPLAHLSIVASANQQALRDVHLDRTLHFPDHTSLGVLYWLPPECKVRVDSKQSSKVGEAKGVVGVPKRANLLLKVGNFAANDPSLLTAYGPNFFAALNFGAVDTDDKTLAKISELTGLQALDLRESDLSDQGLKGLSKLKKLEELYLSRTSVSDQGLDWLLPLGSLKKLVLDQTKISNNGLKSIQKCRNLQDLAMSNCHITDAGLASLATLSELTSLELDSNKGITAKGLMQLAGSKLIWLSIRDTSVTAKDLPVVEKLSEKIPSLKFITVNGKSFTSAAVREWQFALPHISTTVQQNLLMHEESGLFAPLHSWSDR